MNLLLAIPVFNEARYLASVLDRVRRYVDRILIVDDGSTDDTPRILDRQTDIFRVRHPENRGYGQSLSTAFSFAVRHGYDWLITMDCDNQHEPEQLPQFIAAARADDADIISGSRYLEPHGPRDCPPPDRREINREITELLNETLGLGITDAFCGFKAYRTDALRRFEVTIPGYAMPLQIWVQAAVHRMRIRELPVRLIYNDPTRHFGGMLDDPDTRRQHYLVVLARELARRLPAAGAAGATTAPPAAHSRC